MNSTISKTSTPRTIAILVIFTLLAWGVNWALSNGLPARWFSNPPAIETDQPALQAVAAIYAVDPTGEKSAWEDSVCLGMTAKGCALFRAMYAPVIWKAATQRNEVSVTLPHVMETLEDGAQIWRVSVAVNAVPAEIYVRVEADPASDRWLLERILFTQEAAQYVE